MLEKGLPCWLILAFCFLMFLDQHATHHPHPVLTFCTSGFPWWTLQLSAESGSAEWIKGWWLLLGGFTASPFPDLPVLEGGPWTVTCPSCHVSAVLVSRQGARLRAPMHCLEECVSLDYLGTTPGSQGVLTSVCSALHHHPLQKLLCIPCTLSEPHSGHMSQAGFPISHPLFSKLCL